MDTWLVGNRIQQLESINLGMQAAGSQLVGSSCAQGGRDFMEVGSNEQN